MLQNDFNDFQNLLLEKKAELINSMSDKVDLSLEKGDSTDKLVEELDLSLGIKLRHRQRNLIRNIDRALAKITTGNFGSCESCEEDLSQKRLKLDPSTRLCLDCREELEENQKNYNH